MSGLRTPPTDGVLYGEVTLPDVNDPVELSPEEEESGSVALRAWDNNSPVYIGFDENVDSSNGFPLEDGDIISLDINLNAQSLYAIPDSAGDSIRVIATN